jgi:hypothetical protein
MVAHSAPKELVSMHRLPHWNGVQSFNYSDRNNLLELVASFLCLRGDPISPDAGAGEHQHI